MDDPNWFGASFVGDSWDRWRAVLRGAFGLPMSTADRDLFREVAEREPPPSRVRELWAVVGRRGGKDSVAALIAAYAAAFVDYGPHLRPGERAVIAVIAVDREQAKVCWRYISALFDHPILSQLVIRRGDGNAALGLELSNSVDVTILTNSFRSVRGRSIAVAVLDECAFWRDETGANPDVETYNAVLPGLVTLPGSLLVGITTAYRRSGLAYDKWRKSYGKDDPNVLVVKGPSTLFNPSLPQSVIDQALERDREAAAAEWLAEWRSDLSDFLDRELIEAAVDLNVAVRPPQPRTRYVAFTDPSGGRGDSFTCAIAHAQDKTAVLDALYERRAPFDPSTVVAEIAALLKSYSVVEVTGDRYAAQWVVEAFRKEGITYRQSERDRSAIYLDALPLFTSGRARLLDHQRLIHQFASLERRTSSLGKDRVDHGPNGADDTANSAAGALVLSVAKVPLLVTNEMVAMARQPAAMRRLLALADPLPANDAPGPLGITRAMVNEARLRSPSRHSFRNRSY